MQTRLGSFVAVAVVKVQHLEGETTTVNQAYYPVPGFFPARVLGGHLTSPPRSLHAHIPMLSPSSEWAVRPLPPPLYPLTKLAIKLQYKPPTLMLLGSLSLIPLNCLRGTLFSGLFHFAEFVWRWYHTCPGPSLWTAHFSGQDLCCVPLCLPDGPEEWALRGPNRK